MSAGAVNWLLNRLLTKSWFIRIARTTETISPAFQSAVVSGHTHLTEQMQTAGVTFVNSGAVSGLWWKGNKEHTDEGYNVINLFDDGSVESHYTSYGWEVE
jgi:predicted phosphodiesterase